MTNQDYDFSNYRYSSKVNEKLLTCSAESKQTNVDILEPIKEKYEYGSNLQKRNIRPYPAVLSKKRFEVLTTMIAQVPIIWDAAIRAFDSNEAFGEYFQIPGRLRDIYLNTPVDLGCMMMRHDLYFTNGEPMVLEVNVGSRVGGWDHDFVSKTVYSFVEDLGLELEQQLSYRQVVRSFFTRFAQALVELEPDEQGYNILYYTGGNDKHQILKPRLEQIVTTIPNLKNSKMRLCDDLEQLEFCEDGTIIFENRRIHLLMLPDGAYGRKIEERIVMSRVKKKILFVDDPFYLLLGNKMMTALVHEPFVQAKFTPEQRQWVATHVPWSIKLSNETVDWQGETYQTKDFLLKQQQDLVLKSIKGYGGNEVIVGRFKTATQWQSAVAEFCGKYDWIAQAYTAPDTMPAVAEDGTIASYTPVWGAFAIGSQYAGAQVRAFKTGEQQDDDENKGVINAATGACEFLIMEEQ